MTTFLDLNGYELADDDDDEIAKMFEDLGAKAIDQSEFFGWVCNHARPVARPNVVQFGREDN
jgi:prophage maintenance system killer protein